MFKLFSSRIFKSSVSIAAGFFAAFLGVFVARVFLTNNVDEFSLNFIFAMNSLIGLSVVLSVEGFSSSIPAGVHQPLNHLKSLSIINALLVMVIGGSAFLILSFSSDEFAFLKSYPLIGVAGLAVVFIISLGQLVEVVASMTGKNYIVIWRRASIQFLALALFSVWLFMNLEIISMDNVIAWVASLLLGGLIAVVTSLIWLVRGLEQHNQFTLKQTWTAYMGGYWFHHLSKLGLVLPRFILPVIILSLFGSRLHVNFVVLWTVLGIITLSISSVSRSYMSFSEDESAWRNAWNSWMIIILLPLVMVGFLSSFALSLFGEEFVGLSGVLLIGLIAMVPYSVLDIYSSRLRRLNHERAATWLTLCSGVLLLTAVIISGYAYGLVGIMIAHFLVYTVAGASAFVMSRKLT